MEEREYWFITTPNPNALKALDVRVGTNVSDTYSLDGNVVFVKTTASLVKDNPNSRAQLFPPAFSEQVTLEEARIRLKSIEFTPPMDI